MTLKIMSINVNGFTSKLYEIAKLIEELSVDVLLLQETKLRKAPSIAGFDTIEYLPREKGVQGSAVLVRSGIPAYPCDQKGAHGGMEIVGTEIDLSSGRKIRILGTYNSPRNKLPVKAISQHLKEKTVTFYMGDMNAKCTIPLHATTNRNGDALDEEAYKGETFVIFPDSYTRYDPADRQSSCIDIALTSASNAHLVKAMDVLSDIGSDHRPVMLRLNCSIELQSQNEHLKNSPNFEKADWTLYREVIDSRMSRPPPVESSKVSLDQAIEYITSVIKDSDLETIPRRNPPRPFKKRVPANILALIREKRALRKEYVRHGQRQIKTRINQLDRKIRRATKNHERESLKRKWDHCTDKSPHGFFSLARKIMTPARQASSYPLTDEKGERITTEKGKTEIFKNLYEEIFRAPDTDPTNLNLETQAAECFSQIRAKYAGRIGEHEWTEIDPVVTRPKIVDELRRTKNTAPGDDGIHYHHIRNLPISALDYLAEIYEKCIRCCYFPTKWKSGVTALIQKPGKDPSSAANYRPITLLVALGKVLERVVNRKLTAYLEEHHTIPETQAGFRVGRSTQDQLFKLCQDVTTAINNDMTTIASFFDVEKSYDKVWKEGLSLKMVAAKIPEPMIALLVDYLCNRKIRLKVGKTLSSPISLHCGLPQGSILAPSLHNVWVHDIPRPPEPMARLFGAHVRLSQFADDIATWSTARNVRDARNQLQIYNNKITKWCRSWKIKLSPAKSKVIGFTKDRKLNRDLIYQVIDDTKIEHEDQVTFLGITLDYNMSWKSHSASLQKKLKQRVGTFAAITGSVNHPRADNEMSITILKAMIEPVVYYAPSVLCARSKKSFEQQDKLLAQAGRLALHIPKTIGRKYVQENASISPSHDRTLKLAHQYLSDNKRSSSVKESFQKAVAKIPTKRTRVITPGEAISTYINSDN